MTWRTTLALTLGASAACGGAGVTGTAPPQAVLSATFEQAADNSCTLAGQTVTVGVVPDGGTPTAVPSGQGNALGTIGVSCTVHPTGGNTFAVDGTIAAGSDTIFVLHGTLTTTVPDGGIPAIDMTLAKTASYAETDGGCSVTYGTSEGVFDGRVWGQVTCPKATSSNAAGTCQTAAEFRFENCAF